MTLSEEDYIKAIYHLGKGEGNPISTNAIAEQMSTKPSSVTDMVKKLFDKNLVHYQKYKGVYLSKTGIEVALSIIRKHRLWEVFLVEKLDFAWDEVHVVAEQLEHIKSEQLIDKLDSYLGNPKVDPHGDPIPSKDGKFVKAIKKLVSEVPIGTQGICIGVKDSSPAFLKFLDKHKIALGDTFRIMEREDFDGSVQLKNDTRTFGISLQIASNLYLEITEKV